MTGNQQDKQSATTKIKGVFSTQSVIKVGTGSTVRRTIQKTYWFVDELPAGTIELQPLNKNFIPAGQKRTITKEDFLGKFSPEPEFYLSTVFPRMQELDATVVRGEGHRERGELYSAEFEFDNAVKIDEENIRANFGLGLTYLERGEKAKAQDIFERLLKLEATFAPEHKHLFNDFGISMRRSKMYDQALDYYSRASELVQDDENLYYNIARAWFENGDVKKARENLQKAIKINPQQPVFKQFLDYLDKQGGQALPEPSDSGQDDGMDL